MSNLEKNTQSRRDFLTRGLTALAYAAPVVAVLAADRQAAAAGSANAEQKMKMKMKMMGHGEGRKAL